ncbi:MAG: DUF4166 domain-containing protein [Wenzhouxiangellaceae bacterium]
MTMVRELVPEDWIINPLPTPPRSYAGLLGDNAWQRLPAAVRRRFSRRLHCGECVIYRGEVLRTRISRLGRWLVQLARLVGGPLPLESQAHQPSVVSVYGGRHDGDQRWSRQYSRRHRFPQMVHSSKRFAGPSGLEEHIAPGLAIALKLEAQADRLIFRQIAWCLCLGPWRLRLPRWLLPLQVEVAHVHRNPREFDFVMSVRHHRWGELISQHARYQELPS